MSLAMIVFLVLGLVAVYATTRNLHLALAAEARAQKVLARAHDIREEAIRTYQLALSETIMANRTRLITRMEANRLGLQWDFGEAFSYTDNKE